MIKIICHIKHWIIRQHIRMERIVSLKITPANEKMKIYLLNKTIKMMQKTLTF